MTRMAASRRAMPVDSSSSLRAGLTRERRATFGSLVLDRRGVVVSCSDSGVRIFGGDYEDLEGSAIGALISNIAPSDAPPSFNARYMAYLCTAANWRRFQAVDVYGQRFPVEIFLSKMKLESDEMYLLSLRHPSDE